jgi:ketosteroid isomerase-like protein
MSCLGEGIEEYFRLFTKKIAMLLKRLQLFIMLPSFLLITQSSCRSKTEADRKKALENMINTDKAFSEMSSQQGMKRAFIEFIDNNGVLLRANHLPIIGADAIDYLSRVNDSTYKLTWMVTGGNISSSEDLGYTYGIYKLAMKDTSIRGTYVSIWKKQANGKWKFVLDSGNQGIGEKQP